MTMDHAGANIDPVEVAKFDALAARWWDPEGEFAPLHALNPLRRRFIREAVDLRGARVLDVGCGGGILSESLADAGAAVTGIDAAAEALAVARLHLHESGVEVDYLHITAEGYAQDHAGPFDVITCMELLEHVPEPDSVIAACAHMLAPGGHLFLSTLNRRPMAWVQAILGAEFLLGMLPKGTHDYARFIRPAELAASCRGLGIKPQRMRGMTYDPLASRFRLSDDLSVNYLVHGQKVADS
jgi:2-polyprenyl-6-hydroxyphenyl methylase / 3-demethylubiquinone-9 3-methyltransferase